MKVFFENLTQNTKIPIDFPLEAVKEQALEIFQSLPEDDGSYFGLVNDSGGVLQFSKYNRFMWLVEIPDMANHGYFQSICNKNQCEKLIFSVFEGVDPMEVYPFKFESYL